MTFNSFVHFHRKRVNELTRTWSTSMLMLAAFYVPRTALTALLGFGAGFLEVKKDALGGYRWPYKWITGVISPTSGVIGPTCNW